MSTSHRPSTRLAAVLGATIGLAFGAKANAAVTHRTCATPRLATAARVLAPLEIDRPDFAKAANLTGTVGVRVDLAADGSVLGTRLLESSGSRLLDRDAELVARGADYVAASDGCSSLPGSYRLLVDYSG